MTNQTITDFNAAMKATRDGIETRFTDSYYSHVMAIGSVCFDGKVRWHVQIAVYGVDHKSGTHAEPAAALAEASEKMERAVRMRNTDTLARTLGLEVA